MNLYQIYKNEQYTLLFNSVMYFVIGVGMLSILQKLYYIPLLVFIPALANLYLSFSYKKEINKARRMFYENISPSRHALVGVKSKEGFYYLKTDGWSEYFIQRNSLINTPKSFILYRKGRLPLRFFKWSRSILIERDHSKILYKLKHQSPTAIEWCNGLGETVLLYKGNKRWVLNYQNESFLSLQKGYLPQKVQQLFDCHHSYISFFETYSDEMDWLLIFLWLVDSEYYLAT